MLNHIEVNLLRKTKNFLHGPFRIDKSPPTILECLLKAALEIANVTGCYNPVMELQYGGTPLALSYRRLRDYIFDNLEGQSSLKDWQLKKGMRSREVLETIRDNVSWVEWMLRDNTPPTPEKLIEKWELQNHLTLNYQAEESLLKILKEERNSQFMLM